MSNDSPDKSVETIAVNRDSLGRFIPGNCANPAGRPKSQVSLTSIAKTMLKWPSKLRKGMTMEQSIVTTWLTEAEKGNVALIQELNNRLEGKPVQAINLGAAEEFRQLLQELRSPGSVVIDLEAKELVEDDVSLPMPSWLQLTEATPPHGEGAEPERL